LLVRAIFYAFILLALLGDARIFLFIVNRFVYASHREEKTPWASLVWIMPPLLIGLTALFWPLGRWIERLLELHWIERITPDRIEEIAWSLLLAKVGAGWLIIAASVGIFWIVDRIRVMLVREIPIPSRRAYFRDVVARTQALQPDLILLGGDFVSWRKHVTLMSEVLLDGLSARDGVYAVLGNHDLWTAPEGISAALRSHGIEPLINRSVAIRRGGAMLSVAGIDEVYRGNPDVEAAFSRVDPSKPCIALSHHPDIIDHIGGHHIDLLVCGHTHGGQIRLPFFGALFVPSVHEGQYVSGFHRLHNVLMYVSRGVGGVPPIRVLCNAEIATFILRPANR